MNLKQIAISAGAGLIVGILLTGGLAYKYFKKGDQQIKIVKETVTKTEYIKQPATLQDFQDCFNTPITIIGEIKLNKMTVMSTDGCKQGSKSFELAGFNPNKNIIQAGYSILYFDSSLWQTVDVNYLHKFFGNFAFGVGVIGIVNIPIIPSPAKYGGGIRISAQIEL